MNRFALICLLGLSLLGLFSCGGCERAGGTGKSDPSAAATPANPSLSPAAASVEIAVTVDFRDSQPALAGKVQLPAGATAFSALEAFASQSGFSVESTGAGETKFVFAIREVVNFGAQGDNWTYQVNGKLGDRSAGIYELRSGDKVSWIFGKYP